MPTEPDIIKKIKAERASMITKVQEHISSVLKTKITLDNSNEPHPNSYRVFVNDVKTHDVIGYESLMYITEKSDLDEIIEYIQDSIDNPDKYKNYKDA